jgi:hypothetical protein
LQCLTLKDLKWDVGFKWGCRIWGWGEDFSFLRTTSFGLLQVCDRNPECIVLCVRGEEGKLASYQPHAGAVDVLK